MGLPKIKLSNHTCQKSNFLIFRVGQYEKKIDKIWVGLRISKSRVPLEQGRQNSNFLPTHARHMKFLEYANTKR